MSVISESNWKQLLQVNKSAVEKGWAQPGVFGTAVGPDYVRGGAQSILYVGKSAGPLGSSVGYSPSQIEGTQASTKWMVEKRNQSAFWQFIDLFDSSRRSISWTNCIKMDRIGGTRPPNRTEYSPIWEISSRSLNDELDSLNPKLVIFSTSDYLLPELLKLLSARGFRAHNDQVGDRWTKTLASKSNLAILTRHPQGWRGGDRDRVVQFAKGLLATG